MSTKRIEPLLLGKAAVHGIRIKVVEFIRVEWMPTKENVEAIQKMDPGSTLVFTSINAVEALYKMVNQFSITVSKDHMIYATEGRTATRARQLFPSLRIVGTAQKASALAEKIVEDKVKDPIFLCGNLRRQELPQVLREQKIKFTELQVYRTELTPVAISEKFDGIVFFSPSAVSSYFEKNDIKKGMTCFTIGDTTAEALREHTNNKIIVAKQPRQELVIDEIIGFYKGK